MKMVQMCRLEITEIALVHCNIANNDYQQGSNVLCTFVHNKSFGQLLDLSLKHYIFLTTFNSEFLYFEVWFTNENSKIKHQKDSSKRSKQREIEDKINITVVII